MACVCVLKLLTTWRGQNGAHSVVKMADVLTRGRGFLPNHDQIRKRVPPVEGGALLVSGTAKINPSLSRDLSVAMTSAQVNGSLRE